MRHSLFRRTFTAFLVVQIVTVILATMMLVDNQRRNLQVQYETEVRTQARQVAELLTQMNRLSVVKNNRTIQYLVNEKIIDINTQYNADIWIVNFVSGSCEYIDRSWNTSAYIQDEPVLEQLSQIAEGQEITVTDLFPDQLGDKIVTIGVPWTYEVDDETTVVGAVLLHIPQEKLRVSYRQVLPTAILPSVISLIFAIALSSFVSRSQIRPIRTIERSVRKFSTGDLSSRIDLKCGGELQELAETINDMARELDNLEASRKDFVANVSHELRSPMTSIKGYIQAMTDGVIPQDEYPKYLQIVLDETNRLTALVHDLLDLSRLESGRFPMEIAPFDINELMRRALIRYAQQIDEKGLEVEISLPDDPCFVLGDVSRITQVVSNLIDNAVKFLTGDHSKLTLSVTLEGPKTRISVQDNGPGISSEDLPRILERFYKVDKAHTAGMGTGLGLSICKTILQQHSSKIEISSVPNEKTVFSFTLPSAKQPNARALPEGTDQRTAV